MRTRKRESTIRERRNKTVQTFLSEYNPQQLSGQDELQLACKARGGDLIALSMLVNAHLKLVKAVAMRYRKQGLSIEELTYAGNIGLVKAASRFDSAKSETFRYYAIWWIRQSILKAIHEQAEIAMAPAYMVQELWQISSRFSNVEAHTEKDPTDKDMSDLLRAKVYEIAALHKIPVHLPRN